MIAKIKQGKGFGGLVSYANDIKNKDTNIIASEGVDLSTNKSIVASFNIQAKARPTLKAYVGHISLSFSPEDYRRMSDELIAEISRKYLQRMGIVNTQFVIFRHHDKAHDHVHIVYNRVDNDGNAITGDSNFKKSAAITKALTREYGLTFGKGKKNVNRDRLKGKDAAKYRMYDLITAALKDCCTWDSLRQVLSKKGITMDFIHRADGSVKGISFSDGNVTFSGGRIDRALTLGNIQKLLTDERQTVNAVENIGNENYTENKVANGMDNAKSSSYFPSYSSLNSDNGESVSIADDESASTANDTGETSAGMSDVVGMVTELALQPHVVPSVGGGGGSSRSDDDEKDKKKYKPRRR